MGCPDAAAADVKGKPDKPDNATLTRRSWKALAGECLIGPPANRTVSD
jgi:hypothetical protein